MRFAITTLGCKINQYDSAMIETRLTGLGLERCEFDQPADVYIVNTCTITDRADAESLRLARRARRLNADARVIMTGCLAQATPAMLDRSSAVDAVVGLGRPGDLERAVLDENTARVMVSNLRKHKAAIELGAVTLEGRTRAFLKVQEGCDQFCSFCIVPLSRGQSRSVEPRRIMTVIDELHEKGLKEVILSGVHLGGYGKDLDPPISLEVLLEMIAERSPITRIRLSSLDPEELSDRIIGTVAGSDKFCPHFHLPLQAGENEILARMRRRYTREEFQRRVEKILEAMPDAAIGTDLIAGLPGESASQFESYLRFVEELPLAYFHVFPYSKRTGTTAAKMGGQVSPSEIKERAAALRKVGEEKRQAFAARFRGFRLKVLLEENIGANALRGYSRNYLKILTCGEPRWVNHEVEVAIEGTFAEGGELVGTMVQTERAGEAGRRLDDRIG